MKTLEIPSIDYVPKVVHEETFESILSSHYGLFWYSNIPITGRDEIVIHNKDGSFRKVLDGKLICEFKLNILSRAEKFLALDPFSSFWGLHKNSEVAVYYKLKWLEKIHAFIKENIL